MPENKAEFGLKNIHVAFFDVDSVTPPAWEAPIAIPGAVRLTPTPRGDKSEFYADNGLYFEDESNNGYTLEVEIALLPDSVQARMQGWRVDANGGIVEVTNGIKEEFALLFEVDGDVHGRRVVYYNCKASRPSKEHTTTTETKTPQTDVLPLSATPMEIGGETVTRYILPKTATNTAVYDAFFAAVTKPAVVA